MGRIIALVRAYNNADSAPPLTGSLIKASGPIYRGVALVGMFVKAEGGSGTGYSFSYSTLAGTGLTGNANGTITGTPANVGLITVAVTITDSLANTATINFTINVIARFSISSMPSDAEQGITYHSSIGYTGNTGTVTFTTSTVNGLTLGSGGFINGSPTSVGTTTFTTTLTDATTGDTIALTVNITVRPQFSIVAATMNPIVDVPFSYGIPFPNAYFPNYILSSVSVPAWATMVLVQGSLYPDGTIKQTAYLLVTGTAPSTTYTADNTDVLFGCTVTDSLGKSVFPTFTFHVKVPPAIQPKQSGSSIGTAGPKNWDFIGATVTNNGVTATIDVTTGAGSSLYAAATWFAGNAYTATPSPAITAYVTGKTYIIKPNTTNTGSSTLNISGLGAKNIQYQGSAIPANMLALNGTYNLVYDGTAFQMTDLEFLSQTANTFFAAPNGSSGTPTFRFVVGADLPSTFTKHIGFNFTLSSWGAASRTCFALEGSAAALGCISSQPLLMQGVYWDGSNWVYSQTGAAVGIFYGQSGTVRFDAVASGTSGNAATLVNMFSVTLLGTVNSKLLYAAQGSMTEFGTLGAGGYVGWNRSGGNGETCFGNHRAGASGGFAWWNTDGTTFVNIGAMGTSALTATAADLAGQFQCSAHLYATNALGNLGATATADFGKGYCTAQEVTATNCTLTLTAPRQPGPCYLKLLAPAAGTIPTITLAGATVVGTVNKPSVLAKSGLTEFFWDGTVLIVMAGANNY